jgi:hypothetical protein
MTDAELTGRGGGSVDELLERAAEAAHDAWMEAKLVQEFHAPDGCPCRDRHTYSPTKDLGDCVRCGKVGWDATLRGCFRCHKDIRPYADLEEATKELDRAHVRAVHGVYAAEVERLRADLVATQDWPNAVERAGLANKALVEARAEIERLRAGVTHIVQVACGGLRIAGISNGECVGQLVSVVESARLALLEEKP